MRGGQVTHHRNDDLGTQIRLAEANQLFVIRPMPGYRKDRPSIVPGTPRADAELHAGALAYQEETGAVLPGVKLTQGEAGLHHNESVEPVLNGANGRVLLFREFPGHHTLGRGSYGSLLQRRSPPSCPERRAPRAAVDSELRAAFGPSVHSFNWLIEGIAFRAPDCFEHGAGEGESLPALMHCGPTPARTGGGRPQASLAGFSNSR